MLECPPLTYITQNCKMIGWDNVVKVGVILKTAT